MPESGFIEIEVACAWPEKQLIRSLQVPPGTTALQALRRSGLADEFTSIDYDSVTLGVFGRVVPGSYVPGAGERIEVYRPLRRDPREARRIRAAANEDLDRVKRPGNLD